MYNKGCSNRSGYILYVVLTIVLILGIFVFSLSGFHRNTVVNLSHTAFQSRLVPLAQAGANEVWAVLKSEANIKNGNPLNFGDMVIDAFNKNGSNNMVVKERFFDIKNLPVANQLAGEIPGADIIIKGYCRLYLTDKVKTYRPSYTGHIEVIAQACIRNNPTKFVEVKERREIKAVDLRDFLDDYSLFVKDYSNEYNLPNRHLIVENLAKPSISRIYLGSSNAPKYEDFRNSPNGAPIYFDINFTEDAPLIPNLLKSANINGAIKKEIPVKSSEARNISKNKVFWSSSPIPFKTLFSKGGFQYSDFYDIKELQECFKKHFLAPAQGKYEELSLSGMIQDDWRTANGVFGKSGFFQGMVKESINTWKYLYAYTDAQSIWQKNNFTDFAQHVPYSGLSSYLSYISKLNPDELNSGKMPQFFGKNRNKPAIIEGNLFVRFFKIALFDEFQQKLKYDRFEIPFSLKHIPMLFTPKDKPSYLNHKVNISNIENVLMSRAIKNVPLNSLFGGKLIIKPEKLKSSPKWVFPNIELSAISYKYKTGEDFVSDRVKTLADGSKELDIDGIVFIENGQLDLHNVSKFRGNGIIWVGFRGDCFLGNLKKTNPTDTLKIWLQNGDFIIKSQVNSVHIEASLIALTYTGATSSGQGKLIPYNHNVEIYGNLAVDYFLLRGRNGVPEGGYIKVIHDRNIQNPKITTRVTIGQIRTSETAHADKKMRFIK